MTPDEIKAKLQIDGAEVRLNDTQGWHWINVTREHNGHRHTHTARLPLEPSDAQIKSTADAIERWWNETINP